MDYLYGFITGMSLTVIFYELRKMKWMKKKTEHIAIIRDQVMKEYDEAKGYRQRAKIFLNDADAHLMGIKKLHIAEGKRLSGARKE